MPDSRLLDRSAAGPSARLPAPCLRSGAGFVRACANETVGMWLVRLIGTANQRYPLTSGPDDPAARLNHPYRLWRPPVCRRATYGDQPRTTRCVEAATLELEPGQAGEPAGRSVAPVGVQLRRLPGAPAVHGDGLNAGGRELGPHPRRDVEP